MVPFASRLRVVDFVLRNATAVEAKKTFIFSNVLDDLTLYVRSHPQYRNDEDARTHVVLENSFSLSQCAKMILTNPTQHYIIYNGDSPCLIDFEPALAAFKAKKKSAVLYMLNYDGRPSMSRTALICDRKSLQSVVNTALKEKVHSPNIFEMIINRLIIKGIKKEKLDAFCRPLRSIPDYYNSAFEAFHDRGVWNTIFADPLLKSGIQVSKHAMIGRTANIARSYVSEGCEVHGTVEDSILFPGVFIGEKAVIRRSIILPWGRIGAGARIERSVIDEFTDNRRLEHPWNISPGSVIGLDAEGYKNAEHPSLYDSITLIGKNCILPEGTRIGSACYVSSGIGEDSFARTKILDDGLSIVRPVDFPEEDAAGHAD
jgi:glucose-1-phosphate adenylyltransferase